MRTQAEYRGRFAPSPTGPLHFGSLVAALGSYLDARHHQGQWLLRVEDLDPPREVAGSADAILKALEAFGMDWDGPVGYQSKRSQYYDEALETLDDAGYLFGCACTRKEIADSAIRTETGNIYPGTCRAGLQPGRAARSIRVRVNQTEINFTDRLQGNLQQKLDNEVGDFIVRRADMLVAYQLAVVVDDAKQEITSIVRGADLLDSTPRQLYLQKLLGLPAPDYLHLPVAVNTRADKLSKHTHARAVMTDDKNTALIDALLFLQQKLPESPRDASQSELLQWAIDHWKPDAIPAHRILPAPARYSAP
jgi:glutamyl-Q tRNA(Asp) synthetase